MSVLGKIDSIIIRDPANKDRQIINPAFQSLVDEGAAWSASVKKDGSCGVLLHVHGKWGLYRRQDIKRDSRNYAHVGNRENGELRTVSGRPCWVSTMLRGSGRNEKYVHVFIFDLTETGELPVDPLHYVGFVAVDPMEDKWVMSAVEDNPEDQSNPYVWVSQSVDGSLDVPVVRKTIQEVVKDRSLLTVELMCRKFADHYGYVDDRCFISPHGAEIIPYLSLPLSFALDHVKAWFENDAENRWANQEGLVVFFPFSGKRFKLHRGHADMEQTWLDKKSAGIVFSYA